LAQVQKVGMEQISITIVELQWVSVLKKCTMDASSSNSTDWKLPLQVPPSVVAQSLESINIDFFVF
jgi:hypothetical protein